MNGQAVPKKTFSRGDAKKKKQVVVLRQQHHDHKHLIIFNKKYNNNDYKVSVSMFPRPAYALCVLNKAKKSSITADGLYRTDFFPLVLSGTDIIIKQTNG